MSYSWFVFGRTLPSFKSASTMKFRVGPWPGPEDPRDWEDLTAELDFEPAFWAELPLANGAVPSEVWNAHRVLARYLADAMHGVALNEDGGLVHAAPGVRRVSQEAFDGWVLDLWATAERAAELRLGRKGAAPLLI